MPDGSLEPWEKFLDIQPFGLALHQTAANNFCLGGAYCQAVHIISAVAAPDGVADALKRLDISAHRLAVAGESHIGHHSCKRALGEGV